MEIINKQKTADLVSQTKELKTEEGLSPRSVRQGKKEIKLKCAALVKVHLTPKYFFRSNKSLHLFETHCAFLLPFNPNLYFYRL